MSRLLENSEQIREQLEARNLYTPENPYDLDGGNVVNTVNALTSIIKPFSSFDLSNTVYGRLIGPNTPLAQIGLVMLGKQFAATVASNASAEYLPSIKFENIFDGDPDTKFIMRKRDFQITRRESQTNIGKILEEVSGSYSYSSNANPFKEDSDVKDFVANTGKGQLQSLFENVNRNIYKLDNQSYLTEVRSEGIQVSLGTQHIKNNYFPTQDSIFYPFSQYLAPFADISNTDYYQSEILFLQDNKNGVKEYGSTQNFIDKLGKTSLKNNNNGAGNYDFESRHYGVDDSSNENLVWGRDGATSEFRNQSLALENPYEGITPKNPRFSFQDKYDSFNINSGILSYTKNLLNAKGKYGSFDLTRKKFLDTDGQLHFNGSPLDRHPDDDALDLSRRHSTADPYDRYAKAIRFDGNIIYGGNSDSVIYRSVIPKFAPTLNETVVDNRNLMFSIENLASQVVADEESGVGYLQDESATSIPLCEVGSQNGRLMWFPPYDIRLNEQAVARWENTNFIGRAEPIYTYSTSERLATLSFKMLIDYPPHINNYRDFGEDNYHKKVSEFFAFGGKEVPEFDTNLSQKEALLIDKTNQREEIQPTTIYVEPNPPELPSYEFYFPNDYPKYSGTNPLTTDYKTSTNVETIINLGYEDGIDDTFEIDGVDNGLNIDFLENFSGINNLLAEVFNQNDSNKYNENGEAYYKITIEAGATQLYNSTRTGINQSEYNEFLSRRRQLALKEYLEDLIKTTFGKPSSELGIRIDAPKSLANGSSNASDEFADSDTISELGAKEERYAKIIFKQTEAMVKKEQPLTVDQQINRDILDIEINALQSEIQNIKRRMAQYSPCLYELPNKEGGYEKGFKSMYNDRFYPVFHTQTPEDFHRRLTFLHQCTRQGPAVRVSTNGITSSKNSVFGRQPICILRFGDFFHTKIVIDNISFDYVETTWDLNPEGRGMQPMIAEISIQMKIIGGQSLKTPIDALQNAVSYNYYANSTFTKEGTYATPALAEAEQNLVNKGLDGLTPQEAEELQYLRGKRKENINKRDAAVLKESLRILNKIKVPNPIV